MKPFQDSSLHRMLFPSGAKKNPETVSGFFFAPDGKSILVGQGKIDEYVNKKKITRIAWPSPRPDLYEKKHPYTRVLSGRMVMTKSGEILYITHDPHSTATRSTLKRRKGLNRLMKNMLKRARQAAGTKQNIPPTRIYSIPGTDRFVVQFRRRDLALATIRRNLPDHYVSLEGQGSIEAMAVSKRTVFVVIDGRIHAVDVASGKTLSLDAKLAMRSIPGKSLEISVSLDDRYLVAYLKDIQWMEIVDLRKQTVRRVVVDARRYCWSEKHADHYRWCSSEDQPNSFNLRQVQILPDGKHLIGTDFSHFWIVRLSDGKMRMYRPAMTGYARITDFVPSPTEPRIASIVRPNSSKSPYLLRLVIWKLSFPKKKKKSP